jgi:hypothetical protein
MFFRKVGQMTRLHTPKIVRNHAATRPSFIRSPFRRPSQRPRPTAAYSHDAV